MKRLTTLMVSLAALAGCGGSSESSDETDPTGSFAIIDARTGNRVISDTNPGYRSDRLVFAKNSAGTWVQIYEMSRDQWFSITGTRPWNAAGSLVTGTSGSLPATHLSRDDIDQALVTLQARIRGLRLPTVDDLVSITDPGVPATGSVFVETGNALVPVTEAGSIGHFFGITGNARETLDTGYGWGGSWADNKALILSPTPAVPEDIRHPLHGLRLVWTP
jgi:hypothetical protein